MHLSCGSVLWICLVDLSCTAVLWVCHVGGQLCPACVCLVCVCMVHLSCDSILCVSGLCVSVLRICKVVQHGGCGLVMSHVELGKWGTHAQLRGKWSWALTIKGTHYPFGEHSPIWIVHAKCSLCFAQPLPIQSMANAMEL